MSRDTVAFNRPVFFRVMLVSLALLPRPRRSHGSASPARAPRVPSSGRDTVTASSAPGMPHEVDGRRCGAGAPEGAARGNAVDERPDEPCRRLRAPSDVHPQPLRPWPARGVVELPGNAQPSAKIGVKLAVHWGDVRGLPARCPHALTTLGGNVALGQVASACLGSVGSLSLTPAGRGDQPFRLTPRPRLDDAPGPEEHP